MTSCLTVSSPDQLLAGRLRECCQLTDALRRRGRSAESKACFDRLRQSRSSDHQDPETHCVRTLNMVNQPSAQHRRHVCSLAFPIPNGGWCPRCIAHQHVTDIWPVVANLKGLRKCILREEEKCPAVLPSVRKLQIARSRVMLALPEICPRPSCSRWNCGIQACHIAATNWSESCPPNRDAPIRRTQTTSFMHSSTSKTRRVAACDICASRNALQPLPLLRSAMQTLKHRCLPLAPSRPFTCGLSGTIHMEAAKRGLSSKQYLSNWYVGVPVHVCHGGAATL